MKKLRALIVDDEADIRELLSITLGRMEIDSDTAENITQGKRLLQKNTYALCLTDMRLPDGNGIDFVSYIQQHAASLPVAVITAHGNTESAVQAMKAGAFDFVNKPIDLTVLRTLVNSAVSTGQENKKDSEIGIIGHSKIIKDLIISIHKLSRSQAPVYISGESGTGKELVARSIHKLGARSNKPFIPVNCGAIPKELVESEFFGHKKGAFTGANQDKEGLFQAAEGGTLFLDEVADLPLDIQVKLLRAIQEKAVRPVGGHDEIKTNVRVLSATHKNLLDLVDKGEFRQDLFYRLNVIQVSVPSLKERPSDITLLVNHFLKKLDSEIPNTETKISKEAQDALVNYSFPGNVRELENILERAFTLCENNTIKIEDLQLNRAIEERTPIKVRAGHYQKCLNHESIDEYLSDVEREIIADALEHVRWNKTMAAKKLGISFRSFRYRLSKLGLADENDDEN